MRAKTSRRLRSASLCVAAALIAWSCGSREEEDVFPDIKGTYGGISAGNGSSGLRWVTADGSVATRVCYVMIKVTEQSGAAFAGSLNRMSVSGPADICAGQGEIVGEIARDRTIRFQLTQQRWATCTAPGAAQYTGTIIEGQIDAYGTVQLLCDEGSPVAVQEHIQIALPHMPLPGM
jgi:hypothetical protein